jgi:hypothetical protein
VEAAARHAEETLLPQVRQVPGFTAHYLIDAGQGTFTSVAVFETEDGADRANGLISSWFRNDWPTFRAVPPEVSAGRVLAHTASARPVMAASDGALVDRRLGPDRRGLDRRARDRRIVPMVERIRSAG